LEFQQACLLCDDVESPFSASEKASPTVQKHSFQNEPAKELPKSTCDLKTAKAFPMKKIPSASILALLMFLSSHSAKSLAV